MTRAPTHVAHIGFHLDPQQRPPSRLLVDWWPLVHTAETAALHVTRVTVIQACARAATLRHNGVNYHFVRPEPGRSGIGDGPAFAELIRKLEPDVLHVHGFDFPRDVLALAGLAPDTPILLQDHANGVPRFWRRPLRRRGMYVAAGLSFCATEQAAPFARRGLIAPHVATFEIPECSSRFTPGDQRVARALTGVHGDPAILWVGHLDPNKDPLTVLAGVSDAIPQFPDLQMWCCFGKAPLLAAVKKRIANDSRLQGRVHLLGSVPHHRIEQLMRAADVFVSGSHREGSGFSVIEALACGLAPVVTDIPSFRALLGGRVGATWPCNTPSALSHALRAIATPPRHEMRIRTRAHFECELSFDAVGRKLALAYEALIARGAAPHAARRPRLSSGAAP
ncbi:MAG: hypothetical protein JWN43_303 [Gammaproteobacteria bacterium]|nr:hypothetical protein [Gammaproteobacteria bacterium]